jgi:acetylglutamate kinase
LAASRYNRGFCWRFSEEYVVDEAIRKARVLVEALSWIRQFRGRYVVIKLGGSTLENPDLVRSFLTDVLFLETVGMKPILIHGGGKDISRAMEEAGIEPRWVSGRRFTDAATLNIASSVLAEKICQSLVDELQSQGGEAVELSFRTTNCLIGEKLTLPSDDGEIDLGFVGHVVEIDEDVLARETEAGRIPVIPCVAMDRNGQLLNVNGDTAAAAVARLLKAEKLVFVSDVPGIMRDPAEPGSLISHITVSECRGLIADGTIGSGMVPKVEAALEAIEAGVGKLHIVDGRTAHSVLLEIYSDQGIGTEIVA